MTLRQLYRWMIPLAVLILASAPVQADVDDKTDHVPVLGYFLAFLFTVLSLVVLCMPSRKS